MTSLRPLAAIVCCALIAPHVGAQITVFDEKFFGDGDLLNGKTPDTTTAGEAWNAGPIWGDDGIHFSPTSGRQSAHLDFTPEPDRVYTASTRVRNAHANAFGFGFMPASAALNPALDAHFNKNAYAWIAVANSLANDQQGFLGPGTGNSQPWSGDLADPSQYLELDVILNTAGTNWTVQWVINGSPQGAPVAFAVVGNPGIGGVGMSREIDTNTPSTFAETSYFRLTYTPIPEPTSLTLLALGGWMLIRRRR